MIDRRTVLALSGAAVAGMTGCTGSPAGDDAGEILYSGTETRTIQPHKFLPYRFTLEALASLRYSLTVLDGPNVDIIATTEEYLEGFTTGGDWQFFQPASVADTAETTVEAELEPGEWVLIVDNSGEGRATPWTATPTGTPPDWESGRATPTPTPEGLPVTIHFEYAVRSGPLAEATASNGTDRSG